MKTRSNVLLEAIPQYNDFHAAPFIYYIYLLFKWVMNILMLFENYLSSSKTQIQGLQYYRHLSSFQGF